MKHKIQRILFTILFFSIPLIPAIVGIMIFWGSWKAIVFLFFTSIWSFFAGAATITIINRLKQ